MILGVGIDLLNSNRVKKLYLNFSDKFAKKILSNVEFLEFKENNKNQINFLAKKFCVKEAFSKAIGTGIGRGIGFCDITIEKDKFGKPYIILSNNAISFIQNYYKIDIKKIKIDLSITDEIPYINCFVVISTI